jgi:hypothetical protein
MAVFLLIIGAYLTLKLQSAVESQHNGWRNTADKFAEKAQELEDLSAKNAGAARLGAEFPEYQNFYAAQWVFRIASVKTQFYVRTTLTFLTFFAIVLLILLPKFGLKQDVSIIYFIYGSGALLISTLTISSMAITLLRFEKDIQDLIRALGLLQLPMANVDKGPGIQDLARNRMIKYRFIQATNELTMQEPLSKMELSKVAAEIFVEFEIPETAVLMKYFKDSKVLPPGDAIKLLVTSIEGQDFITKIFCSSGVLEFSSKRILVDSYLMASILSTGELMQFGGLSESVVRVSLDNAENGGVEFDEINYLG